MLGRLIEQKLKREGASMRAAARIIGISHTTLGRAKDGESVDMDTLVGICNWLGVTPSSVLDDYAGVSSLEQQIALLVESVPELEEVFGTAMERYKAGETTEEAIVDLVRYAAFRFKE